MALEDVQPHGLARRLVQDEAEVVEAHHLVKPGGKLVEQRGQIAVRDDRFRNGQQGPVRLAGGRGRAVYVSGCHGEDPGRSLIRDYRVVRGTRARSHLDEGHLTISQLTRPNPPLKMPQSVRTHSSHHTSPRESPRFLP